MKFKEGYAYSCDSDQRLRLRIDFLDGETAFVNSGRSIYRVDLRTDDSENEYFRFYHKSFGWLRYTATNICEADRSKDTPIGTYVNNYTDTVTISKTPDGHIRFVLSHCGRNVLEDTQFDTLDAALEHLRSKFGHWRKKE